MTEDSLDRLLREDAQCPMEGEVFCARVMQALPARAIRHTWLRPLLVLASTAMGGAIATSLAPIGALVTQGFADLARLQPFTHSMATVVAMVAVITVAGVVLAADD